MTTSSSVARTHQNREPILTLGDQPTAPQKFDRVSVAVPSSRIQDADHLRQLDQPPPSDIMPAEQFAAHIVRHIVEVLLGHRPARQIQTWMTPKVFNTLLRRASLSRQIYGRAERCKTPQIRRTIVCYPRPRVAEVSLVVFDGRRIRAAATRLEIRHDRWHVTALEII